MVAKNASISGPCSVVSNFNSKRPNSRKPSVPSATSNPAATGSGMLYVRNGPIHSTSLRPSSSTSVAHTNVPYVLNTHSPVTSMTSPARKMRRV